MIGVEGQYVLKFSVSKSNTLKDFISEPDLVSFKIIEEAGNLLPIYELIFYTDSETIFQMLHEGNDLECTFGKDKNNSFTTKLTITNTSSSRSAVGRRLVHIKGMYSNIPYITNSNMFISDNKSGIEVMLDKAKSNFGKSNVISNITKSLDSQRWIQPNSSDKKFMNELWLHSDLGNSFPAIGISTDGKFILKDMILDIKGGDSTVKWKFLTDIATESNEITYDGNASIETNTGFINNWMGYGRQLNVVDLDTSFDFRVLEEASPIVSMSSILAKRIEINKRFAAMGFQNENTHANYWSAYMYNLTCLASLQNVKIGLTFQSDYKFIRVLDKVFFKDEVSSGSSTAASEFCSGVYYVSKVSRNITNRLLSTTVILNREAINAVKVTN